MMKYSLLLVGLVAVASPAIADEYYIVRGPDKECRVVETRPADTTIVQVGPLAFKTREEAERERVVLCKEDSDSGDKVIIKRD
jgi:hypothetical protein